MKNKSSFLLILFLIPAFLHRCTPDQAPLVATPPPPIVLVCGFDHSKSVEDITHVDTHALKTLLLYLLDLNRTVYLYADVIGSPNKERPIGLLLNGFLPRKGPNNIFAQKSRRADSLMNREQNIARIEQFIRQLQTRIQLRAMSPESDILGFLQKAATIFSAPDFDHAHKSLILQTDGEQATFQKGKHFICGENFPDVTIYALDWSMDNPCPDIEHCNAMEDFTRIFLNPIKN